MVKDRMKETGKVKLTLNLMLHTDVLVVICGYTCTLLWYVQYTFICNGRIPGNVNDIRICPYRIATYMCAKHSVTFCNLNNIL